jgi:hypothetical protein
MNNNIKIAIICAIFPWAVYAQPTKKPSCDCRTKKGEYSVTTDGKMTLKSKNAKGQFVYDLAITFKNEVNCAVYIPSIQFNDINIVFEPKIKLTPDAKGRKKPYRKLFTSATKLTPVVGLDDMLFADLLVDYDIGEKACNLSVTIEYDEYQKK